MIAYMMFAMLCIAFGWVLGTNQTEDIVSELMPITEHENVTPEQFIESIHAERRARWNEFVDSFKASDEEPSDE